LSHIYEAWDQSSHSHVLVLFSVCVCVFLCSTFLKLHFIQAKVQEMGGMEKLKHIHRLLLYVSPVVKQIYADQCFEIGIEAKVMVLLKY
jgi:hypothetical protein